MDLEKLQHDTEIIEQANVVAKQLVEVSKVCLLYNNGAPADSCMERIKQIITGDTHDKTIL